jgi:hypothetical protein
LSSLFGLGRGCRQGDPISPYICLLCGEILGNSIRSDKNIKGITLWNEEFKLSQYDTDILLELFFPTQRVTPFKQLKTLFLISFGKMDKIKRVILMK